MGTQLCQCACSCIFLMLFIYTYIKDHTLQVERYKSARLSLKKTFLCSALIFLNTLWILTCIVSHLHVFIKLVLVTFHGHVCEKEEPEFDIQKYRQV